MQAIKPAENEQTDDSDENWIYTRFLNYAHYIPVVLDSIAPVHWAKSLWDQVRFISYNIQPSPPNPLLNTCLTGVRSGEVRSYSTIKP